MPALPVVFLHGAGRAGASNWPSQAASAEARFHFLDRDASFDDAARDANRLITAVGSGGHAVAHSYGAIAAMRAAATSSRIRSLVLVEPACFSIARGRPGTEAHIAAWAPVFAVAKDSNVNWREWSRRFAEATGTPVPDVPEAVLEQETARLRATVPPWSVEVDSRVPTTVPTLVLTGDWNDAYEDVAEALSSHGARHVHLVGHGHRPHDHDRANNLMQRHWSDAETAPAARG